MVRHFTNKLTGIAVLTIVAATGLQSAKASPMNTDLNALWGVTPGGTSFTGSGSSFANWTPGNTANQNNASAATAGSYAGSSGTYNNIFYSIWDGYGPRGGAIGNNGGQQFDVKAMYASYDATYLHVGIVTGTNPDSFIYSNGHTYTAGDLAFNQSANGLTADFGLMTPLAVATTSGTLGSGVDLDTGGTWSSPGFDGYTNTPPYTVLTGGTALYSDATYSYIDLGIQYSGTELYFMEFNIKKSELGADINSPLILGFGPSCGNDFMTVNIPPSTGSSAVPEPASLSIMGVVGAGLLLRRRKRA